MFRIPTDFSPYFTIAKRTTVKILIIEDEPDLNKSLVDFLNTEGYLCESAITYKEALDKIDHFIYDCIVLDIMLPGGSGLQLLHYLKEDNRIDGIIIISAKGALEDKIEGLRLGADDYLMKPFHFSELSVRISAIIRRKHFSGNTIFIVGPFRIDTTGKSIFVNDQHLELTQKEFQLLLFLIINRNRVLSKTAIAEHLWGDDMSFSDSFDFIYAHIKNLRKKIQAAGVNDPLKSIYGEGYKMELS